MIALEHLLDGSPTARNFEALARLVLDTGGRSLSLRWGAVALPFTASVTSAATVVPHGLPTTPVAVFYGVVDANLDQVATTALAPTTFTAQGRYVTAVTGSATVYWLAIG